MKRRIRLTEGSLKRMIKESVRQVLNESSFFYDDEIMVLKQFGLNPQLVSQLCNVDKIPVYDYESENEVQWTNDFYINVDVEEDDIQIHINGYDAYASEDESVIDEIKEMCNDLKNGGVEKAWFNFTHRLDRGY